MGDAIAILAPAGRDAEVLANILRSAGVVTVPTATMARALSAIDQRSAGALIVSEEALTEEHLSALEDWLAGQLPWSDLPIILLTTRQAGTNVRAFLASRLGNATLLERPLQPLTLISAAKAALRARSRQHDAEQFVVQLGRERNALEESEARYRQLFNLMDEGFCVIEFLDGPSGKLSDYVHVSANPAFERHAGIANVVGRRVQELVPDEADGWVKLYRDVLLTGNPVRFERELVATHRFLELSALRIEPASRRQVAVLFQDITARKRAEAALLELNQTLEDRIATAVAEKRLFADVVDGTDAFVIIADLDYNWLAINAAARRELKRLFNIDARIGMSMLDALAGHPSVLEAARASWARAFAGEHFSEVIELGDPNGYRRSFEIKFSPLRDAADRQIGAYQFVTDITERLRDQARLADAAARMHEMAKIETIGQLTGGVAHDFNNLLTPIVSALDILSRRFGPDERPARLIEGALQAADRAAMLVQRLLAFARRQALEPKAVNVRALLDGMHDLVGRSIGADIEVTFRIEEDTPAAHIDPNQLELAILNLAVNARDAMPDGGALTVSASQRRIELYDPANTAHSGLLPGRYVVITVSDTGKGMDEATVRRAVEPFFTTKDVGKGTGLGLSMIHGLAAQSGGALRLLSEVGRGTTAELWLPATDHFDANDVTAEKTLAEQPRTATILLVDDEELVRSAIAEMLRGIGHRVIEVDTSAAALAALAGTDEIDLMITDYLMPRMRGSALIEHARRLRRDLPVLIVTGYADLAEGEAEGVPRLAKPLREADLANTLAPLLQNTKAD